jgi:Bacterial Ig domain
MSKRRLLLVLSLFALAAPLCAQTASFVDDRGRDVSQHAEFTRIHVRLADSALDVSGGRDTAEVILYSAAGGDNEVVTLRETGDRTGVFQGGIEVWGGDGSPFFPGTLETFRDPASGYPDDTILLYRAGLQVDTATVVSSLTKLLDERGEEVSSYAAGERVHVRVQDRFYQTPGPDMALVRVQTSAGDDETLPLVETSIGTGFFAGSLPGRLGSATPGDGIVQTAPGVTITARHDDLNGVTFSAATAAVTPHSLAFVDVRGNSVSTVFPGSRALLRVVDRAADFSSLDRDFLTIQASSQGTGDGQSAVLIETGPATGVFEGWVNLASDSFVDPEDGRLSTSYQGPDQFDTITATHTTPDGTSTATVETRWSVTRIVDDHGQDAVVLPLGGAVRVQVDDPVRSEGFFLGVGTSTVDLRSLVAGDVETLTVEDADPLRTTFEGAMPVVQGDAVQGDGVLQVSGTADTIEARHFDANGQTVSSDTAGLAVNLTRFLDERGKPTEQLFESSYARVQVLEPTNDGGSSTTTVTSEITGRTRDLSLAPVEGRPGTFEGSIDLTFVDPVFGNPDFATGLPVSRRANSSDPFDTVTAEYSNISTSSAAARTVSSVTRFVDASGNDAGSYVAGQPVHLQVRNPSRSDLGVVLQTTVRLTSLLTGDSEIATLGETAELSGLFTGSFPTSMAVATAGDGVLQTIPGDSLSALHDVIPDWAAWSVDTASVTRRSIDFVDAQGAPVDVYLQDGTVFVRAVDVGANVDPAQPDVLTVTVVDEQDSGSSVVPYDSEALTLAETGPSTSVFTGSIELRTTDFANPNPSPNDGVLEASNNAPPYAGYDTLRVFLDGIADKASLADSFLRFVDAQGEDASFYALGDTVHVRLERQKINDPSSIDVTFIRLRSITTDDDFEFTLTETGADTGVFLGSIPTGGGPEVFGDGILQAQPGETIEASVFGGPLRSVDRAKILPNGLPVARDDTATTLEDTPVTVGVLANDSDPEGQPLTVVDAWDSGFGSGLVEVNPDSTITFTPYPNSFGGIEQVTYTVSDGVDTTTAILFIEVTAVPDPPIVVDDAIETAEDTPVVFSVLENDSTVEGQLMEITAVTPAANGNAAIRFNEISYTPNPDFFGTDTFTYTATDNVGLSATATVTVTVSAVSDVPLAFADAATTNEDTAVVIAVAANDVDPDGQPVIVEATLQPTHGAAVLNADGTITYTPAANFSGTDSFNYTLRDFEQPTWGSSATVTVTVNPVNDPPDAAGDAAAANEDTAVILTVLANDVDVDGDALQVTAVTQGSLGAVTLNANDTVTYTPAANVSGADSFTYTVRDAGGATDIATVTVTIAPINDAPVAVADAATTRENASTAITVLANDSDVDGNTLTVTSVSNPPGGTAVVNADNSITYTADANFNGTDTFTYTLSDGQGTATGTVTVTVKDALERVAVLGTHGVWLQTGADVLSGDVIANQAGAAPFLDGGSSEVSIAGSVATPSGYDLQGDSVNVTSGATVASDAFYNQITGTGSITGPQTSPLALPVFATLPALNTATPGASDVNVANNGVRTLAAGSYRDLIVGRKGTVTFTGGVYHFRSIRIDREAKLFFSAASEIRVQQKIATQTLTTIQPAAGASIAGADILFHVAGVNGTSGGLAETPKAVEIGTDNTIRANVYAPNGTVWLKDRTQARGAYLGKDVQVGVDGQVTLESAFAGQ